MYFIVYSICHFRRAKSISIRLWVCVVCGSASSLCYFISICDEGHYSKSQSVVQNHFVEHGLCLTYRTHTVLHAEQYPNQEILQKWCVANRKWSEPKCGCVYRLCIIYIDSVCTTREAKSKVTLSSPIVAIQTHTFTWVFLW